jgi:opacity protein-like surface antigen
MYWKMAIIFVLLFLLFTPALSQIAIEWEMLPASDGDNLTYPFDKTSVATNDYKISLGIPLVLASKKEDTTKVPTLVLSNALFYSNKHLIVEKWPNYQDSVFNLKNTYDHLVSFGYSATLTKTLNKYWSILGIAGFTYAGFSPDKYRLKDIGINGGIAGVKKWDSGWTLGFGLYYGRLTGVDALMPIIIVQKKTEHTILNISLPSAMSYWYIFNNKINFGLTAEINGDMYIEPGAKVAQYDKNGQLKSTKNNIGLAYSAVTIGPALKYSIMDGVSIIARTGLSFARRYQYWIPDDEEVQRWPDIGDPSWMDLTGHDYSGEKIEFPMKSNFFFKLTVGVGI